MCGSAREHRAIQTAARQFGTPAARSTIQAGRAAAEKDASQQDRNPRHTLGLDNGTWRAPSALERLLHFIKSLLKSPFGQLELFGQQAHDLAFSITHPT